MSLPETFKALIIESKGQKPKITNVPLKKPGKNQALVKMEFAPMNPSDMMTIQGSYPVFVSPPHGVGMEGSGTIAAVGEDLKVPQKVGDKVHVSGLGTYAEYLLTDSENCTKIKEGLPMDLAACHIVNPMTVHYMAHLVQKGGHKAAIHTAGSSVLGRMIIRYFKHKGLKLINIVRRDEVIPELKEEGAEIILNSKNPDFEEKLKEVAEKEEATICFESIIGDMSGKVLSKMPNDSTMYIYGALSSNKVDNLGVEDFIFKGKTITGLWLKVYVKELVSKGELEKVRDEVHSLLPTILKSPIQKVFSLDQFFEGQEFNEKNSSKGKVLIKPNQFD